MKEIEETKNVVKTMNVNAVAELLVKVQDQNHQVLNENVDIKRMLTQNNMEMAAMRSEISMLKAMGFRGNMGTGSTVHTKDE